AEPSRPGAGAATEGSVATVTIAIVAGPAPARERKERKTHRRSSSPRPALPAAALGRKTLPTFSRTNVGRVTGTTAPSRTNTVKRERGDQAKRAPPVAAAQSVSSCPGEVTPKPEACRPPTSQPREGERSKAAPGGSTS